MARRKVEQTVTPMNPLVAELEKLRAENEALKAAQKKDIRLAVSAKGALSVYGIRRFPITLYRDEWEKVFELRDEIRKFLVAHKEEFRDKGEAIDS